MKTPTTHSETHVLKTDNTIVKLVIDVDMMNDVIIQIDNLLDIPKIGKQYALVGIPKTDFLSDMKDLLPNSLSDEEIFDASNQKLFDRVQKHIRKYGRLLDSDRHKYIAEYMFLFEAISEAKLWAAPTQDEKNRKRMIKVSWRE